MDRMEGCSGVLQRSVSDIPGSEAVMDEERCSEPSLPMLTRPSFAPGNSAGTSGWRHAVDNVPICDKADGGML